MFGLFSKFSKKRKGRMFSFLLCVIVFILFSTATSLFAAPYLPGTVLDPTCAPGALNCTVVVEPAIATFATVTGSYAVDISSGATDQTLYADSSGGDVVITLPSLATAPIIRRTIHIIKVSPSNSVFVNSQPGDFINVTTALQITDYRRSVKLESISQNQWLGTFNFDAFSVSPLSVRVATDAALPTNTYNNGASGVGATLTADSPGALPSIDSVSFIQVGNRILVKDELSEYNGVYQVTSLGGTFTPWVLTRTTDSDQTAELDPQIVIPTEGSQANRGKQFVQVISDPIIGTIAIKYVIVTGISACPTCVTQDTTSTQQAGQVPFWTVNSNEVSGGNPNFFWDNATGRLGIGTTTPSAALDIIGSAADTGDIFSVFGTTPSQNETDGSDFVVITGPGSIGPAGGTTAGKGGSVSFSTGNGGFVIDTATPNQGGGFDISLGSGSQNIGAGAPGGTGGTFTLSTGEGGAASGAGALGGNGGAVVMATNSGGANTTSPTGSGGSGGNFLIMTGIGGLAGASGAGGNGGQITLSTGNGTTGFTNAGSGGNFSITLGNAGIYTGLVTGATGGGFTLTAGNGSVACCTGTPGAGGAVSFTGGNGGSAVGGGTNANGGSITLNGGAKSTGGSGGTDGNVILANARGRVGIGLTAPSYPLHVKGDVSGVVAKFEDTAGTNSCTINASTSISCSSDRTLKKDIADIDPALSALLSLHPVSFRWNGDDASADKKYGFIAQDVEPLFPTLVLTDVETNKKSLSMVGMIPFIVKGIQELNLKIDAVAGAVENGFVTIKEAVLGKLTVGSKEKPSGITIYDEATGEPYCIKVVQSAMQTMKGECQVK